MKTFTVDAEAIEINADSRLKVRLQFDAEPSALLEDISVDDIVANVDVDDLLKRIGKDAAAAYWDLTDAEA